jgi:hypothetical protein
VFSYDIVMAGAFELRMTSASSRTSLIGLRRKGSTNEGGLPAISHILYVPRYFDVVGVSATRDCGGPQAVQRELRQQIAARQCVVNGKEAVTSCRKFTVYHSRFVYAIDYLKKSNVAVHNKPYVIVVWFSHDVT